MPRLTTRDYLIQRQFLVEEWFEREGAAFGNLPLQNQRDLHDYYAPSVPFTDQEALTHREQMTEAFPPLPQKAGRAYQAVCSAVDGNSIIDSYRAKTMTVGMIGGRPRMLRVAAVANPEIDHVRLARAMLNLAKEDIEKKFLKKAQKIARRRSS